MADLFSPIAGSGESASEAILTLCITYHKLPALLA